MSEISEEDECTEYTVLRELIDLYKSQPCLWDTRSPNYRSTEARNLAWAILLSKYREIEPDADVSVVRKKINSMKAGYQRESRKVNKSIMESTSKDEIYEPHIWYYNLLSFLNKNELSMDHLNDSEARQGQNSDEAQNDGVYMLIVNDNCKPTRKVKRIKKPYPRKLKRFYDNSHYMGECEQPEDQYIDDVDSEMLHYTQQLKRSIQNTPKGDEQTAKLHNISPFAVYIGKQLEVMSPDQRNFAEKVISEVIFLGKTDNLRVYSRIESNPPARILEASLEEEKRQLQRTRKKTMRIDGSPEFTSKAKKKCTKESLLSNRPKRKTAEQAIFININEEDQESPSVHDSSSPDDSDSESIMYNENGDEFAENVDTNISSVSDDNSNSILDEPDGRTSVNDEDSVLRTLLLC